MDTYATEQLVTPTPSKQEISITLREQVLIVRNESGVVIPTSGDVPDENAELHK